MSKKALYSKYRPFQLSDVIGQQHVTKTLKQASIDDKFVHSYMFGGVKGTGKTSTARIIANLLNCEDVKDGVLCGECKACKTIPLGVASDVIELDGAKNRKVEDINALIEGAQWSPSVLKKKVMIIDEAHQLTGTAISALLKIVEEPPSYLTFIFCTTEVDKIPNTILSRSQLFNFKKINFKDIAKRLTYIAEQEKIDISEDAVFDIAKLGRGSMRDAIGFLQQIDTIASGKRIEAKSVQKYFGITDRKVALDIVTNMINKNVSTVIDRVNDLVVSCADTKGILYEISEILRNIMILKVQKGDPKWIDLPEYEIQQLIKMGKDLSFDQLNSLSQEFSSVKKELEYSINERWVMESTLIRCMATL